MFNGNQTKNNNISMSQQLTSFFMDCSQKAHGIVFVVAVVN